MQGSRKHCAPEPGRPRFRLAPPSVSLSTTPQHGSTPDSPQNYLSFSEIVQGRPALVRLSHDDLLSAVDLVKVMTGQDNSASNQDLNRLKPSVFSPDHFVVRARHKWVAPEHALKLAQVVKPAVNPEIRGPIMEVIRTLLPAGAEVEGVQAPTEVAMPFDEILAGATVRFTTIDGVQYLSIRDFIMVVCDKDGNDAGQVWRRLSEDKKNEVQSFCLNFVFPGQGQQEQPVITFPGALKLVMWLGGENAKDFRTKVVGILTRYFAGDPSLLQDIQANAQSDSPINQFARASLQSESGDGIEPASKRQKLDMPTAEEMAALERFVNLTTQLEVCNRNYSGYIDVRRKEADFEFWREDQKIKLDSLREQERLKNAQLEIAVDEERTELEPTKNHNKIKTEQEMLKLRQANYSLGLLEAQAARDSRKDELLYARPEKHVQSQPLQPTAQDDGISQPPASTTTVLKVFHAHKSAFAMLPREQTRAFLIKAGHLAKQAYVAQFGLQPERAMEQGYHVNVYPSFAEPLIRRALRGALRDITAGGNQPPLRFSVVVPGKYGIVYRAEAAVGRGGPCVPFALNVCNTHSDLES